MITLAQLLTPVTQDEAENTLLTFLSGLGFQATSWQDGSIQKTLIKGFSNLYSALSTTVSDLAGAGYPSLSKGLYQDALGQHFYDLPRVAATATEGEFVLTLSAAAAPAAWAAGDLVFADAAQTPANSFRILEAGSLAPGGSDTFNFAAESPGEAGNIPSSVPLFLWTPVTGLSATNPPITGTSTWITAEGQDEESPERYADRMIGRWSRLTYGNTEGAYSAWALEALPALTRVFTVEGTNEGDVRVVGATASGGLTGGQITTIRDYIMGTTDGIGRRPINDNLIVESATALSAPALALTVTCDSAFAATCSARVTQALIDLFGELPIGGERISPSTVGYVYASRMYSAIMSQQGVRNVTGIPPDIALGATEIYTPSISVVVVST